MSGFAGDGLLHTALSPVPGRPPGGRMRVVRMPTVVDLPAPLGPRRPKISPGRTSRESPARATISIFSFLLFFSPAGAREKAKAPAIVAAAGADVYTLRRSPVRIDSGIVSVLAWVLADLPQLQAG